jgi:hypothetical protein
MISNYENPEHELADRFPLQPHEAGIYEIV